MVSPDKPKLSQIVLMPVPLHLHLESGLSYSVQVSLDSDLSISVVQSHCKKNETKISHQFR